jgi:hypothetical protein
LRELYGLLWLLLLTGLLLLLQRSLHREIQAVFLLITRSAEISRVLFSILFFPGIVLHETSHYLMALILGVRTGRFSLLPRQLDNERLQLGYVETAHTDIVRDALIGAAPLLTGGVVVAYIGMVHFGLPAVWQALPSENGSFWFELLPAVFRHPDFWLWLYLAFVVSSTMLPSRSDRRAWLPIALVLGLLLILILLIGVGPWLVHNLAPKLYTILSSIIVVFGISVVIHLALWPPFILVRILFEHVTGFKVT